MLLSGRIWPALLVAAALLLASPPPALAAPQSSSSTAESEGVFEPRGLRLLVEVVGDRRVVEGRLSGGFEWGPWADDHAAGSAAGGADVELAIALAPVVAVIEDEAAEHRSTETLHTLGLLRLVQQRWDEAVAVLEEAAAAAPEGEQRAAILSDLAAAYLARGRGEGRAFDLARALDATGRALEQAPELPEPAFNHALVLGALPVLGEAARAWDGSLELDRTSAWAVEAREHLDALDQWTLRDSWQEQSSRLETAAAAGDRATVESIADGLSVYVRGYGENVALAHWGEALLDGDPATAGRHLTAARTIGEALTALDLGASVADAVAFIDEVAGTGDAVRLERLAEGHRAMGQAHVATKAGDTALACDAYRRADEALTETASPFGLWAKYWRVVRCVDMNDAAAAREQFASLRDGVPAERYPALAGLLDWMIGLTSFRLGELGQAVATYEDSLRALSQARHPETATMTGLLAEAFDMLGDPARAWEYRLQAFADGARFGHYQALYTTLLGSLSGLLEEGLSTAALPLAEEMVRVAEVWGYPTAPPEAHHFRARVQTALGKRSAAMVDLGEADRLLSALPVDAVTARIAMDTAFDRAELLLEDDPAQGISLLEDVAAHYRKVGYVERLPQLYLMRARAHLAKGEPARAEKDLARGFRQISRRRSEPMEESLRITGFERFQGTLDEMVRFHALERKNPEQAFAYAESARGRALLDWLVPPQVSAQEAEGLEPGFPEGARVQQLQRALPEGVVLVEYAVLPEMLLIWVVRGAAFSMVSVPVPAPVLADKVERFITELSRGENAEVVQVLGAELYDDLIRPLRGHLRPEETLVFVPDRFLHGLPFAALYDRETRRYLVEDHASAVAPSASVYLAAAKRRQQRCASEPRTVLAVGNPAFDRNAYPDLPDLTASAAEAEAVAALYPGSEVLLGEEATKERLLEAIPRHPILHIAGHVEVHPTEPLLSWVLLAPGGEGGDSGLLYAYEIADLDLSCMELVVLSGCRTAGEPGRMGREGVAGLARAFLAAGVPAVVASLWEVEDEGSSQFSRAFYRRLLNGRTPPSALREEQALQLTRRPVQARHSVVGFVLMGGLTDP